MPYHCSNKTYLYDNYSFPVSKRLAQYKLNVVELALICYISWWAVIWKIPDICLCYFWQVCPELCSLFHGSCHLKFKVSIWIAHFNIHWYWRSVIHSFEGIFLLHLIRVSANNKISNDLKSSYSILWDDQLAMNIETTNAHDCWSPWSLCKCNICDT